MSIIHPDYAPYKNMLCTLWKVAIIQAAIPLKKHLGKQIKTTRASGRQGR